MNNLVQLAYCPDLPRFCFRENLLGPRGGPAPGGELPAASGGLTPGGVLLASPSGGPPTKSDNFRQLNSIKIKTFPDMLKVNQKICKQKCTVLGAYPSLPHIVCVHSSLWCIIYQILSTLIYIFI